MTQSHEIVGVADEPIIMCVKREPAEKPLDLFDMAKVVRANEQMEIDPSAFHGAEL